MYRPLRNLTFAAALSLLATAAAAQGLSAQALSTSANSPTPVAETGLVTGNFAAGAEESTHYLSVDLKPGDLAAQIRSRAAPAATRRCGSTSRTRAAAPSATPA